MTAPPTTTQPPLMSRTASRLMSRQDVDTKELVDRLPSAVKKAKSTSQLVFEYDNRHRDKSAKSEFVQSQLHEFDDRIAELEPDEDPFYSVDDSGKVGEAGRKMSTEDADQGRVTRSKSLTSLATPRSGRPRSEILYFTYVESGKEMDV